MYKITAKHPDNTEVVIYDPYTGIRPVLNPKMTRELNQPGSLDFTLVYGHDAFEDLEGMKDYVTVERDGDELFYGRVLDVEPAILNGQETVTCEGAMSFLNDGHLAPDPRNSSGYVHQTMTAEAFYRRVIAAYNAEINNDPRRAFSVGIVDHPRKAEERQYQITNYISAKEAIEQNILNNYGGFIRIRKTLGTNFQINSELIQANYFQLGNVRLLKRPVIPAEDLVEAGWEDAGDGYATIYSSYYDAGSQGIEWGQNVIIHITPILSDGTVLSPAELDDYVDDLLTGSTIASILENDVDNLVLWVQDGITDWTAAHSVADTYDDLLHRLQAVYYLEDYESMPDQSELREFNSGITIESNFQSHLIDWIESYDIINNSPLVLGENIITQTNRMSGEDMFTAIRPVGQNGLVHSTTPIIDLYSQEEMAEYGRIIKNVDFPNITTEAAILQAGQALAQRISTTLYISSEISVLDLHFVDGEIPPLEMGETFTNIVGLEGIGLTTGSISNDIENPQNDSISLKNAKHLEGNGLDDFKNNEGSLSKRSAKSSGGVGMALKYYHELDNKVDMYADTIFIHGQQIDLAAGKITLQGNQIESLSNVTGSLGNRVTGIEGTGVIQNSAAITAVAGHFRIEEGATESDPERVVLIEGAKLSVEEDGVYSDVIGENGVNSHISQMADQIRSEVSASNSTIYSSIQQTASSIRTELANTESGLYNYVLNTASGTRQMIVSQTNRVWIQEYDPTTEAGGSNTVKDHDMWVESTHQGTWDGADGFDWEHDEDFDWFQVQGAKIWGWKNNQWELISDQQQVVSYSEVVETAEYFARRYVRGIVNDEGMIDVYEAKLEQTAHEIRAEVAASGSTIYSSISATASNIRLQVAQRPRAVTSTTAPTDIDNRGLKEDDIWIMSEGQENWDAAFDKAWDDDSGIDWNALRSDSVYVYHNGKWELAVDGTQLIDEADIEVDRNLARMYAKRLEYEEGRLQAYYSEFKVTAKEITSDLEDKYRGLESHIKQTATQLTSTFTDRYNNLGSSITQTAREIRTEVHAANSQIYSSISQTASQIRSEVGNTLSGIQSSITQQANKISLVVDSSNHLKVAEMVIAINSQTGQSISRINADLVTINGSIKLSDALKIENGGILMDYPLYVRNNNIITNGSIILMSNNASAMIDASDLSTTIKSATKSGDTLILTTYGGQTINFSKPSATPSWGTAAYVDNTNNLPSGTKHQVNGLKTAIVNNRTKQGYIYFTITVGGTRHVYYFADNGNGWTS